MGIGAILSSIWAAIRDVLRNTIAIMSALQKIQDDLAKVLVSQAKQGDQLDRMEVQLGRIEEAVTVSEAVGFNVEVGPPEEQQLVEVSHMAFAVNLTATQFCRVKLNPVDKKGNPAPIEGGAVFASDAEDKMTFKPDPDDPTGLTGIAWAVGPVTDPAIPVNLTVTGDADLGEGIKTITETGLGSVVAGQAGGFGITVGAPEEQRW